MPWSSKVWRVAAYRSANYYGFNDKRTAANQKSTGFGSRWYFRWTWNCGSAYDGADGVQMGSRFI